MTAHAKAPLPPAGAPSAEPPAKGAGTPASVANTEAPPRDLRQYTRQVIRSGATAAAAPAAEGDHLAGP
jgi:hypothetical protein